MNRTIQTIATEQGRIIEIVQHGPEQFTVYVKAAPHERTYKGYAIDHRLPLRARKASTLDDASAIAAHEQRMVKALHDNGMM